MNEQDFLKDRPTIVIDKDGGWFYNGLPIINREIYLFLNQLIEQDPAGGYRLRNGAEICPIEVQDTPFVVTSISRLADTTGEREYFQITLNDETSEPLDLSSLSISAANIPYCTVKEGRFPARFLRAPYYCLAESVEQDEQERFFIELNAERHYLT